MQLSMSDYIYLDYQATTPCDERIVQAMLPYFSIYFGNAHSDHIYGQYASEAVELARKQVADCIGAVPQEITFTSGATEANNIAILGAVKHLLKQKHPARRVITVATEHKSVLETVQSLQEWGVETIILPVGDDGLVDPNLLSKALEVPTLLVSVMMANNETGVLQPIRVLAEIAHQQGALFHCDMVQALGKTLIQINVAELDVDLASFSGHKIYAPKGIGALYVRKRPRVRLSPLFFGGYQERGIRSGTLSVPLIVGFGKACELIAQDNFNDHQEVRRLYGYRQQLLEALQSEIPIVKINGCLTQSIAHCINLSFPGVKALDILSYAPHLCLSTGSACTKMSVTPSYVLMAMGLSEEQAFQSFRLSFGRMTTQKEVDLTISALCNAWHNAMTQ